MTIEGRSWLPPGAAMPRAAQGAVMDMIDAWSRAWFAREGLGALGSFVRLAEVRTALRKTTWHACEGGLAIGLPQGGVVALGALALGVEDRADRPATDAELLDRVGGECLDDLKTRAATLFALEASGWSSSEATSAPDEAVHQLTIGTPARSVTLILQLSASLFARFVRARLPLPPKTGPLGDAGAALAPLAARLSAVLGSCGLTVSELSTLAPGDVLVLDSALDARLPIAIDGVAVPRGSCTVTDRDGAVALKIAEALAA
jgi:flagellar motor switch/type III secretory pathway protein FliN